MYNWTETVDRRPQWTGKYLVWTSSGPEILIVEENSLEYGNGELADWSEIEFWAEIGEPNSQK